MRHSKRRDLFFLRWPKLTAALAVLVLAGSAAAQSDAPASPDPAAPVVPEPPAGPAPSGGAELNAAREAALHGKETVVSSSRMPQRRSDATVPTEVITRQEIEATGARDLGELLESQPGVEVVRSFAGDGIRLQGMETTHVLILIDGERIAGRVNGVVDASRFSLRDVERVEIVKGPASVLYGSDAMGGVINLITRRASRPLEGSAQASYGTMNTVDVRAQGGMAKPGWAVDLGGGYRRADGFDLDPRDQITTGPDYTNIDVAGDASVDLSPAARLSAIASYTIRDRHAVDGAATGALFDRRNRTEALDASLRNEDHLGPDTDLLIRAHHSQFRDQLLQDQRFSRDLDQYQDARERIWEAGAQLNHRIGGRHAISAGAEGLIEDLESPRLLEGRGQRQRLGLFAEDEWKILPDPRLVVSAGVRVDLDTQFGVTPSPRVAARFDPVSNVTLRASYGWGFRAPSFQELLLRFENPAVGYVVDGNPDLRPEVSRGLNVSAEYRPIDSLLLSLAVFRTDIQGLITVVTNPAASPDSPVQYTYGNIATGRSQGFEVAARARLLRGVWLDLGYAFTDARDLAADRYLEGRPIHRGTFQLTGRYRPWALEGNLRGSVVGPRPFYLDEDGDGALSLSWTKPYADVDFRVAKDLFSFLTVFGLVRNILDAGDPSFLPLPPRSFHLGVIARY